MKQLNLQVFIKLKLVRSLPMLLIERVWFVAGCLQKIFTVWKGSVKYSTNLKGALGVQDAFMSLNSQKSSYIRLWRALISITSL